MKRILLISLMAISVTQAVGQQPKYTKKNFVSKLNPSEFADVVPGNNGLSRTYLLITPQFWDTDDANQTYIRGVERALVCIEGTFKNGSKNGLFRFYLIDSLDHSKKYKIWEQDIINNKLNGQWRTFSLKGNMVNFKTFRNDSLNGISRNFSIDGAVTEEWEYSNGRANYIYREYTTYGHIASETTFKDNAQHGPAKRYYPNGVLKEEVILKDGEVDGVWKYYYPSGAIWVEYEYKNGLAWNIIANYTEDGAKRNPGTLKNGYGTIILYNNDGTPRETLTYQNGVQMK